MAEIGAIARWGNATFFPSLSAHFRFFLYADTKLKIHSSDRLVLNRSSSDLTPHTQSPFPQPRYKPDDTGSGSQFKRNYSM